MTRENVRQRGLVKVIGPSVLTIGIDIAAAKRVLASEFLIASPDEPHPFMVVVSGDEWERMVDERDEREAITAHERTSGEEALPHAMVKRLAAGENAIKVWREHRGMTLTQLGEAIGKQKGYLSEIESGKKVGTVETLRAIAKALRVDLDDIT